MNLTPIQRVMIKDRLEVPDAIAEATDLDLDTVEMVADAIIEWMDTNDFSTSYLDADGLKVFNDAVMGSNFIDKMEAEIGVSVTRQKHASYVRSMDNLIDKLGL